MVFRCARAPCRHFGRRVLWVLVEVGLSRPWMSWLARSFMALSRSGERGTWVSLYTWLPVKRKQLEVMGTPVGCLSRALRCLSIPCGLGCSGDPVGLNYECFRRVDMLQVHRHRSGHRVSLTRRRRLVLAAKAGARTGPVAVRTVRGHEHGQSTVVIREVLPGAVSRAPKVISSWSAKGRSNTPEVVVVQLVPGERFSSYQGSSAWVNTKVVVSGPLVVHDGEHRTNSMVVVQHSSWGRFSSCRGSSARVNTKGLDSGPLVVHDEEHRTNSMVIGVSSLGFGRIHSDPIRASHNRPVHRWPALVGILVQGAAFLHCGPWTSRMLGLLEQNVFDGPVRVPPMVVLGFFFEILPSPTMIGILLQVASFLLRGPGTSEVLSLLGLCRAVPLELPYVVDLGFFFEINPESNSGRHFVTRNPISPPWSGDLWSIGSARADCEYSNGCSQVLDVPGEDFRLHGFPFCPCTSPTFWSRVIWEPVGARWSRPWISWLAHSFMALSQSGELGTWVVRMLLLESRRPSFSAKMLMPKISGTTPKMIARCGRPCTVTLYLVVCKREAARNNGDTGQVSATGTPMLKLAMTLMSKQRGRALVRKSCPYLNKWANPVFIDIPCGLRCSSDPVGLNFECSRWVDMLQVHRYRGGHRVSLTRGRRPTLGAKAGVRIGPVAGSVSGARRRRAADAVFYAMSTVVVSGSVAKSGVAGSESDQLVVREGEEQYIRGDGRSILFLRKGSVVAGDQPTRSPFTKKWVFRCRMNCTINSNRPQEATRARPPDTISPSRPTTLKRFSDYGGEVKLLAMRCRPELDSRFITKKKPKPITGGNPNRTTRHSLP
ncbi:hypothetical protein TIFTF001_036050 [Ficus carica]|uniref:Uncharacterized protein n=1 Tax=Ficus carica TaxID=3494 RepID=A0AA88JAT2_FICCA|nr:hypothetical protein TIFTF001_036050 [Ficus carica]